MSTNAKIEWMIESAIISVLSGRPAFSGIPVRRYFQAAQSPVYPIIAVYADGAMDTPGIPLADIQESMVSISAFTYTANDQTGEDAAELLGKIRSEIYATGFKDRLTAAEAGLTVHGVLLNGRTMMDDNTDIRRRSLMMTVYATAVTVDNDSSSSSESSSSSSSGI